MMRNRKYIIISYPPTEVPSDFVCQARRVWLVGCLVGCLMFIVFLFFVWNRTWRGVLTPRNQLWRNVMSGSCFPVLIWRIKGLELCMPQQKSPGRIRYRGEVVTDGCCLDKRSEIVTRQRTHLARCWSSPIWTCHFCLWNPPGSHQAIREVREIKGVTMIHDQKGSFSDLPWSSSHNFSWYTPGN